MDTTTRDLLFSWAAAGFAAAAFAYLAVRPMNGAGDWTVIALSAVGVWAGLLLAYRAFMRRVERRAALIHAEIAGVKRYIRGLTVDQARALVNKLIDEGALQAEPRRPHAPPPPGLPASVAEVFREHEWIKTASDAGVSEACVAQRGDLLVIGTEGEEFYTPFGRRADGRWVSRPPDGEEVEWPGPWHWLAAQAIGADSAHRDQPTDA